MRAVLQRVSRASVSVAGKEREAIANGLLVLLAAGREDTEKDVAWMADKIVGLRIFEDELGKMNLSVKDVHAEMIVVSQFTLYGDCRKGRRPSFVRAMEPDRAALLCDMFAGRRSALRYGRIRCVHGGCAGQRRPGHPADRQRRPAPVGNGRFWRRVLIFADSSGIIGLDSPTSNERI